jgi:hypothetical protein
MSEQLINTRVEPPTMRRVDARFEGKSHHSKSRRYGPSVSDFSSRNGYVISRCSISQSIANYGLAISLL